MPVDELTLQMDDSPQAILATMYEMGPRIQRAERQRKWLRALGYALFPVGFLLFFLIGPIPRLAGLFVLASFVSWPVGFLLIRYFRPSAAYPHLEAAQVLLSALQDDAERVVGLLDLTRPDDKSKQVRVAQSGGGKRKAYYRNPWLQVKLHLVDGNVLQISLVDKVKTKSGSVVRRSTKVTAKLAINADLYAPSEALAGVHMQGYKVSSGPDHALLTGYEDDLQVSTVQQLLSRIRTLFRHLEPVGQSLV